MIPHALPSETPILSGVAKRGYTRDTIRGGASDWDVSRPFSSYLRMIGSLLAHPVRFFEVLPRVQDARAPALFLAFSGLPAGALWYLSGGPSFALAALVVPLPLSAVPGLRWIAGVYAGVVLLGIGLATVQETGLVRAALASTAITALLLFAVYVASR